jgi:hypothetical protein
MSALPEALRPWAVQLSLFPEDLALSLGAHVARLAAALGPLRSRNEREGGEPQGYDGLTRRGPPERLLMSEWLMALEAPDEFVRRAAFGEQAYLRPAFRQPQGGRRTVALLDVGPDQLGSPRIAHLALLVVLARRAEAAGAGFSWGVLQSPPQRPFSTVDSAAIGQWLKAGNAAPPSQAQLAAWREALEWGRAPDDVWLVGGARLARLPGAEGLSRVAVDEVVAPGARQLSVEVRPTSRPACQVVLELPPAPQCVRLLRDPFSTAVAAPVLDTDTSAVHAIRFSADGLRLLMAYANGGVAAQVMPHSPRDTAPRPKRFHPPRDEEVVAVGWRRSGGLLVVTRREQNLHVHGSLRGHPAGRVLSLPLPEGPEPLLLPRAGEPPLLAFSQMREGQEIPLVLDAARSLHHFAWDLPSPAIHPVLFGVSALAERRGGLFFVDRDSELDRATAAPRTGCLLTRLFDGWMKTLPIEGSGEAYFGQARDSTQKIPGPPLAVRHRPGQWWVTRDSHDEQQGVMLPLAEGLRVAGLCCWPVDTQAPGLVVLGQDQRTFYRVTADGASEFLVTAPARVVSSGVSHAQPLMAWLTETGEVGAWSFQHRALVFRSIPGGKP